MIDMRDVFNEFINSFKKSVNPVEFIITQRNKIFVLLAGLATTFIILGLIFSDKTQGILATVNKTVAIFVLNYPADDNFILTLGISLAILTVFFGVIILFFSNAFNLWVVNSTQNKNYDLVIGLSNQNQLFLDSIDSDNPALVIESNEKHPGIDKLRRKGIGILIADAATALPKLKYPRMEHCIISTGNDRQNIDLALVLLDILSEKSSTQHPEDHSDNQNKQQTNRAIYVRVECRDLAVLFKQKVIEHKKSGTDIIVYSLCEAICRQLFSSHSLLGNYPELARTKEAFAMVVIGASELAAELVYQIATLAHLPEQNKVTIFCVSKDAMHFNGTIAKRFPGIGNIPNLSIEPVNLDDQSLDFFTHPCWKTPNLVNIFIANNEQDRNLDIAINLQDTTYIRESTTDVNFRTKVFFAMYQHSALEERIDINKEAFGNFYSFADLVQVSNKVNLIDLNLDAVAKLIHYDYDNQLDKNPDVTKDDLHRVWINAAISDRESSRAQAMHIDMKLLALGLKKTRSGKNRQDRVEVNREAMKSRLPGWDIALEKVKDYRSDYFPSSFDSLLDKIARCEHDRWNAFHYARGWYYGPHKNKGAKIHNCLMPVEEFTDDDVKKLYDYDLRSVLRIPVYIAHIGCEIIPLEQPEAKPTEQPKVA